MKQVWQKIKNNKYILYIFIILLYGFVLRYLIPYDLPIHENNHGIFFLNSLLSWDNNLNFFIRHYLFIEESFIEKMNYWYFPKFFYGNLISFFSNDYLIVFLSQKILNIWTGLCIAWILYKIMKVKDIFFISLILFMVLPYNIRFASTEDFFIFWNFFLSLSFLLYIYFLEQRKYIFFYLWILFYLWALYSRNLYLLYLPLYFLLFWYYISWWFRNQKLNYKILWWHFFLGVLFLFLFSFSRLKVLFFTVKENIGSVASLFSLSFEWFFTSQLTPNIIILSIFLWFILPVRYLYKKSNCVKVVWYYIWCLYILFILQLLILSQNDILLQERLQIFFLPFFIIVASVWIYLLIKKVKYVSYIFPFILLLPFFYIWEIQKLYAPHQEFLFYKDNIDYLEEGWNLIILWHSQKSVFNNFPEFLFKGKKYKIYWINSKDKSYMSFLENYSDLKADNNIFVLSYDCYRWQFDWLKRQECAVIQEGFSLEVVSETYIDNKEYIFSNNSNEKKLQIGFYKIISKNDTNTTQN